MSARVCVQCDGPHSIVDCPKSPALATPDEYCTACGKRINPQTAECVGCSD